MRIRAFLSSTALVASLAAIVPMAPALAQKGVILSPSTEWAVTRVDDKTGQGAGYCALARRFRQDTILTIARNEHSETSFALDFQRPQLDTAQSMSITLDPGAGQQRVYDDVQPVSAKALVVRLGQDPAFFSALEKTGYLRVETGTNSYSFNLADIDAGQLRLDACIAAMIAPAAGDETLTPEPPPQMASGGNLKLEINNLRREIQALKAENQRRAAAQDGADIGAVPVDQYADTSDAVNELAALKARLQGLEEENRTLTARLAQSASSDMAASAAQRELETLKAEIEILRGDNQELKEIANAAGAGAGADRAALASLTDQNRRLQEELGKKAASSPDTAALSERIAALESENLELRETLQQEDATVTQESQQQVLTLKEENRRLQQALADQKQAGETSADLMSQVAALKTQNDELTRRLEVASLESQTKNDFEITQYKTENENLKAALEKKGADNALLEQLRQQIGQMQNENRLLQETAAKAQEQLVAEKQAELDAAKVLANVSVKQSQEAQAKAQQMVSELQQKIANLETENATLKKDVALASAAPVGDMGFYKAENERLTKAMEESKAVTSSVEMAKLEIEGLKKQNQDLLAKLAASDAAAAKPSAELATALLDNQRLKVEIEQKNTELAQATALKTEMEGLKKENQDLQAKLVAGESAATKPSEELAAALLDNQRLKVEIEQKNAELVQAAALKTEIESLKQKNTELQLALDTKVNADIVAAETIKNLTIENTGLKAEVVKLAAASTPPADFTVQIETLKAENANISAALEKTLADATALQERVALKDQELATALQEKQALLAAANQEVAAPAIDAAQIQADLASVRQENETLKTRIASLEQTSLTSTDLQQKIDALNVDNQKLQGDLEKTKAALEIASANSVAAPSVESEQKITALEEKLRQAEAELQRAAEQRKPEPPQEIAVAPEPEEQPEAKQEKPQQVAALDPAPLVPEPQALIPAEEPVVDGQQRTPETASQPEEPVAENDAEQGVVAPDFDRVISEQIVDAPPSASMSEGYTEAQLQEMALAQDIESGVVAARSEPVAASISASHAEDPFAEIEVLEPPARPESSNNAVAQLSPAQESEQSPATMTKNVSEPVIGDMLAMAQIVQPGQIEFVEKASGPERKVYQWRANDVYGSAEQVPLQNEAQFDTRVKDYLEKTQQRCKGDFAIVPDNTLQQGATRIDSYEIACIGQTVSSSASILFFNKDGIFTAMAHEASAEQMETAMDIRDRLMKSISGT